MHIIRFHTTLYVNSLVFLFPQIARAIRVPTSIGRGVCVLFGGGCLCRAAADCLCQMRGFGTWVLVQLQGAATRCLQCALRGSCMLVSLLCCCPQIFFYLWCADVIFILAIFGFCICLLLLSTLPVASLGVGPKPNVESQRPARWMKMAMSPSDS